MEYKPTKIESLLAKTADDLKRDEGYRHKLYKCTADKWTIGIGYNIEDRGLPDEIIRELCYIVMMECYRDLCSIFGSEFFESLPEEKQSALLNMIYNLGRPRFAGFKKMIAAIRRYNWEEAAYEALDSRWANQVGVRAKRIADIIGKEWTH